MRTKNDTIRPKQSTRLASLSLFQGSISEDTPVKNRAGINTLWSCMEEPALHESKQIDLGSNPSAKMIHMRDRQAASERKLPIAHENNHRQTQAFPLSELILVLTTVCTQGRLQAALPTL